MNKYVNKQQIKEGYIISTEDGLFKLVLVIDYTAHGDPIKIEVVRETAEMCAQRATELGLSLL